MAACEWCGQPATRKEPMLCAECYFKYWTKSRSIGSAKAPLEQITKLDCERCRLRTEHYVQSRDEIMMLCRCLRCGQLQESETSASQERFYPDDDRRPVYVS